MEKLKCVFCKENVGILDKRLCDECFEDKCFECLEWNDDCKCF